MADMHIKPCQNTNPVTAILQLDCMFVNNNTYPQLIKVCFPSVSQTP